MEFEDVGVDDVTMKSGKDCCAEEQNVDLKKENINEKADETPNSSVAKTELSENVPKSKASNQHKVSISGTKKNNKVAKDSTSSSALTRSRKGSMAKSLSFPARGGNADITRKSINASTKKSDFKSWIPNGVTHEASHSNGTVLSSASRLKKSVPSLRQSLSAESISSKRIAKKAASEGLNDEKTTSVKATSPLKDDEDARSATSLLEERSEKRKELSFRIHQFLAKVEERIHAREEEKSNLLAKSKIPTTYAISPKLGRNKNSTSTTNSSESGGSCFSPKVIKEQRKSPLANKDTAASKGKPVKNSQTSAQSPKTSITKAKPAETKSKLSEAKGSDEKTCTEKTEQNEIQPESEMNCVEDNVARPSNNLVIAQAEVPVEG
ncbi:hypothetical protein RND71_036015 [Anisodus tanguticus]|uniref:Uncharacterized protein n=1 Tax=Anisodus tanguticus TaxID=243964 RepID=A0AAE1R5C5_9SOLA|nr:hypothetical protein RND71_036015 [Anisodus tanguticus]